MSRKPIKVEGPITYLEEVSIVLNVYFDTFNNYEKGDPVHELMYHDYPEAVELGRRWGKERQLDDKKLLSFDVIYQLIVNALYESKKLSIK